MGAQRRECAAEHGEGFPSWCWASRTVPFGAPRAETWERPASEFPNMGACPPGAPARADLTWHQQEAAQPARHAPHPGHGPVLQPRSCLRPSGNLRRAARPLPFCCLRPPEASPGILAGREGGLQLSTKMGYQ